MHGCGTASDRRADAVARVAELTTAAAMDSIGFCFFNNVAVAAAHAREALGVNRVMILDWDVHHGNGIQHVRNDTAAFRVPLLDAWTSTGLLRGPVRTLRIAASPR